MVQHVLAERRAEAKAAERTHELGVQIVDANVERSLLARILHLLIDLLFGLRIHLFDARRMDAAVGDEVFHGDAADFATNRIEARDRDAFGRIVDQKVDAGELLEGTDVATLASDDAALQIIGGNMDGLHRGFSGMIGRDALDGEA